MFVCDWVTDTEKFIIITERENANEKLRSEIMLLAGWCQELDMGRLPEGFQEFLKRPIEG